MSRRVLLSIISAVVVLLAIAAAVLFVVLPAGSDNAQAAAVEHVEEKADGGTAKALTQQDWGDGALVLIGYERSGVKRLGLAFASKQFRGWRVSSYTEETVEPDDVVVGSLLIASSDGGDGEPAWSAAVGELIDSRIDRVELKWASGETSLGPRVNDAFLVVQEGQTTALEARYLSKDGAEIAKVPVEADLTLGGPGGREAQRSRRAEHGSPRMIRSPPASSRGTTSAPASACRSATPIVSSFTLAIWASRSCGHVVHRRRRDACPALCCVASQCSVRACPAKDMSITAAG